MDNQQSAPVYNTQPQMQQPQPDLGPEVRKLLKDKVASLSKFTVLIILILIIAGLGVLRTKFLDILDDIDRELYRIESMNIEATIKSTKGVKIGTELPTTELARGLNNLPDSIPIKTNIPVDSSFKIDSDLDIDAITSSQIELPPLGTIDTIDIPIKTTIPINDTIPIDTKIPINFNIPISDDFKINSSKNLSLSTTLPINTEIPIEINIAETNIPENLKNWHNIINKIRQILLSNPKDKDDFSAEIGSIPD
ncbi:MAG: hypothetical protein PHS44_04225 [Candidatus Dojkabacteria bacterium]|nr:hypothetical protein [Candidatus Dojkabacteria bacterium]